MPDVGPNADNTGGQQQQQQSGQQTQDGQQQQQQQQGQDNDSNNDDNFGDLWQDPDEDPAKKQTTQDPQTQTPDQQQAPDADKAFNTYIEGLELTRGVDLDAVSEELNQGKTEVLGKAFNTVASKVYRQAMIDMNKVIDQKVQAGVAAAVQQSSNAAQGNMAVRQMNEALKFTKNPAIAPIAQAALAQFIKKGKSPEEAVESVRKFFANTSKISAKELGLQNPPRGRPGNQPFNGAENIDDDDEMDWLETLGV